MARLNKLGFCSLVDSIESVECLEQAHDLVTSLSLRVFSGMTS